MHDKKQEQKDLCTSKDTNRQRHLPSLVRFAVHKKASVISSPWAKESYLTELLLKLDDVWANHPVNFAGFAMRMTGIIISGYFCCAQAPLEVETVYPWALQTRLIISYYVTKLNMLLPRFL